MKVDLDKILDTYESSFRCSVASQCCWSGELRLQLTNVPGLCDRSIVFFAAGCSSVQEVIDRTVEAAAEWLLTKGNIPLPVIPLPDERPDSGDDDL